jgi:type IV pilus assembly protein PilY1
MAGVLTVTAGPQIAVAAPLSLADAPIFLLTAVDPNIIFTYDDSGSMAWGYMPDALDNAYNATTNPVGNAQNRPIGCSSTVNGVYFDPTADYPPGVDSNGNDLPNAAWPYAWVNGYDTSRGQVKVDTAYQAVWETGFTTLNAPQSNSIFARCAFPDTTARPAFYYEYVPTVTGCSPASTTNDACYRLVQFGNAAAGGDWSPEIRQKFVNWYSYHRVRTLVAKTAAGRSFSKLPDNLRLAYQRLNSCNAALGGSPTAACPGISIRQYVGGNRNTFLTWLNTSPANSGTPLRTAFVRAGQYLATNSVNSPWAQNPGVAIGTEYSCRQNFHLAFTDGLWNTDNPTAYGNADSASIALPDGTSYSPAGLPAGAKIYSDANSNSLGDIAFYYWSRDARPLTNNVPWFWADGKGAPEKLADVTPDRYFNPSNDPATWQHLVNYTVGLGVTGRLEPKNYFDQSLPNSQGDYDELLAGTKTWGAVSYDDIDNVDDLWHAAINSRGRYFSAGNPGELADALKKAINEILSHTGSASSLSANAGSAGSDTLLYQAMFNSSNWYGSLLANGVDPADGTPKELPEWNASVKVNNQDYDTGRTILTYKTRTSAGTPFNDGVRFRWTDLELDQQNYLHINPVTALADAQGENRLNYLRGQSIYEGNTDAAKGPNFRTRSCADLVGKLATCKDNNGRLGDIVNSAPVYVGRPPFRYPDSIESASPYSKFAADNEKRTPMVYVGANDGMLHGFNGLTGEEKIAYVPYSVYPNLNQLSSPTYTHRYYVDGSPIVGDVFIDPTGAGTNKSWRTVLVGGMNKGGRGHFALDITDPAGFSEDGAKPEQIVLWEFTDNDLGYTYSQPSIAKMANGKWAAIFGSGFNNVSPGTGRGYLYIVFIEQGADRTWTPGTDFIKLELNIGIGDTTTPNGVSGVAAVDVNRDYVVDYIYAADLRGNLWRFDVTKLPTTSETDWISQLTASNTVSTPKSGRRSLLFAGGATQPITERPTTGFHPSGGLLVYFGTGKYVESADNIVTGAPTQTFYAIWDRGIGEEVKRANLLQQQVTFEGQEKGFDVRVTSNNPVNWATTATPAPSTHLGWYLDLPTQGERSIASPLLRENKVIFPTLIPTTTPCEPGTDGWIMELDAFSGARLQDTFDLDQTGTEAGVINSQDRVSAAGNVAASGIRTGGGSGVVVLQTDPNLASPPRPADQCLEVKLTNTSEGKIVRMQEACRGPRRESWLQTR